MVSILFITTTPEGKIKVCLSKEIKHGKTVTTLIGGTREKAESETETLFREVHEEVKMSSAELKKVLCRDLNGYYSYVCFGGGRIYFAYIDHQNETQFLTKYQNKIKSAYEDKTLPKHLRELVSIEFVFLDDLHSIPDASNYLRSAHHLIKKVVPSMVERHHKKNES